MNWVDKVWIKFHDSLEFQDGLFLHPESLITFRQVEVQERMWYHFDGSDLSSQAFYMLICFCECHGHKIIPGSFLGGAGGDCYPKLGNGVINLV